MLARDAIAKQGNESESKALDSQFATPTWGKLCM